MLDRYETIIVLLLGILHFSNSWVSVLPEVEEFIILLFNGFAQSTMLFYIFGENIFQNPELCCA
jgi:hypothetical protein